VLVKVAHLAFYFTYVFQQLVQRQSDMNDVYVILQADLHVFLLNMIDVDANLVIANSRNLNFFH